MPLLLVEDEVDNREMVAELLVFEGYQVVQAQDGEAALEVLHRSRVDLIITDVMMPLMSGEQMLAEIEKDDNLRSIPVIVMSAGDGARVAKRFGCAYIAKPLDFDALVRLVRTIMNGQNRRSE